MSLLSSASTRGEVTHISIFISVPISAVALAITALGMPSNFGLVAPAHHEKPVVGSTVLARLDMLGTALVLVAVLSLTAGFEEADSQFPWRSAYVISLLTVSGCAWVLLLFWERHVTKADAAREPVLPWRFFEDRVMVGILL